LAVVCFTLGPCTSVEDSISDYYGTRSRNLFVGILFAIAFFLFAYRGYDSRDDKAGDLACLFALGVALFPGTSQSAGVRAVHFLSATALFLVLSYFSLALFTITKSGGSPTEEKKRRNKLYRACGAIILVCIASIALYYLLLSDSDLAALKPVFWLESVALWSFGLSWLTKGETLWQDAKAG
jgi:drug/metabolite transporter (DMT)-like permease